MSTSPDLNAVPAGESTVLRGATANAATLARFDADLTGGVPSVPSRLVEQARTVARTTGYAEGWAQGQRAARLATQGTQDKINASHRGREDARASQVQHAVDALVRAAEELSRRTAPAVAGMEDLLLRTALELAEVLIGHELAHAPGRDLAALHRAASVAPGTEPLTVRLHPDDHRTLVAIIGTDAEANGRPVRLVADPLLAPGDAVASSGDTTVDATLAGAVARVREVLSP
jgi:flagellar assembly protein FliH